MLIGKEWLAQDDEGNTRIDDPEDWVSLEISTALARPGLKVIPVLLGGVSMPRQDQLPEHLQSLSRRNAIEITDSRWDCDVGRLVKAMKMSSKTIRGA